MFFYMLQQNINLIVKIKAIIANHWQWCEAKGKKSWQNYISAKLCTHKLMNSSAVNFAKMEGGFSIFEEE
jgi:hypothetical protein